MAGSTRSPFNTCRNIYWTPHHRRRTNSTPNNLVGLRDARIACRVALLLPCSVLHGTSRRDPGPRADKLHLLRSRSAATGAYGHHLRAHSVRHPSIAAIPEKPTKAQLNYHAFSQKLSGLARC
ncbi:hypothetical protein IG631_16813 [Alternaria alternata]|nr:hypothetical protein IG631_16813 [Alternaria alternata]